MVSFLTSFFSNGLRKSTNQSTVSASQSQRDMTEADEAMLLNTIDFSVLTSEKNMKVLSRYTLESRERFARRTNSMVVYLPQEAHCVQRLEEEAALNAAPKGHELKGLNGLNIGCGNRRINEYITPVDIMRESQLGVDSGEHHAFLKDAILANPEDLPFKPESLDYIVALHMLEHVANPIEIVVYWGTLLKPGGGIGLVLPDFRYTWNACNDPSQFGHKWNTSADIFRELYSLHLAHLFQLECIATLRHKISFDVVLRKPGNFQSFKISNATSQHSGAELAQRGHMIGSSFDQNR
ncbi:UNVERIFIED_ORG: putative SAM-dependent methyltransferase [Ensifer adhaerens]|nr:putative SAM-dependent methyltransferase [Ensifer adhaerens]